MPLYNYTVTLTDSEQKAMEYVATDVDFWIQNAVHERARIAQEELVADTIKVKLDAGVPVPGRTKEEIVMNSDLPNAQARNDATMKLMMQSMPPVEPELKN